MSLENLLKAYPIILTKYRFPLIVGIIGLIFFVYGLIVLFGQSGKKEDIEFRPAQSEVPENKSAIVVDVSGAVVSPGVYRFPLDARVQDALVKAGGLSDVANREWVAKNLNLAAKISDGGKLYVPSKNENITGSTEVSKISNGDNTVEGASVGSVTGLININTASSDELDTLPGIGPVTAGKIIQNRPYGSVQDLVSKKSVTSKVFEKIKDKITTY